LDLQPHQPCHSLNVGTYMSIHPLAIVWTRRYRRTQWLLLFLTRWIRRHKGISCLHPYPLSTNIFRTYNCVVTSVLHCNLVTD
jgi:hypothetical protein